MTHTLVLLAKYIEEKKHGLSQKKKNVSKNNYGIELQNKQNKEDQIIRKSEPIKFDKLKDQDLFEVAEPEVQKSQEVKTPNKKCKEAF